MVAQTVDYWVELMVECSVASMVALMAGLWDASLVALKVANSAVKSVDM